MGLSSDLREILMDFPFDEKGYTLNSSQCKAISTYFISALERFFGTVLRNLSCYDAKPSSRMHPASSSSSSLHPLPFRGWNSLSVFSDNKVLKLWSMRKNQSSSPALSEEYNVSAILEELRNAPYAIEELYRVVKEAQHYLEACRSPDWWQLGLTLASVNEARDIHIHDLMWCIVGLNLALHTVRGVDIESRSQFARLHIAKCYAEMAMLSSRGSDIVQYEEEDCKELHSNSVKLKQKYDEMNFVRKRVMMNHPEKIKYETVGFLAKRLSGNPRIEAGSSSSSYAGKPPKNMQIDIEDLVLPSQLHRGNRDRCDTVLEASWLGTKVGLKEFDYNTSKEAFDYELGLLIGARCPFVIRLYGWSINLQDHVCYLVQEFLDDDLESLVTKKLRPSMKKPLHIPVVVDLMLQLSRAMEHLHSRHLVHGNLCPSNVLIEPLRSSPDLMEKCYSRVRLANFNPPGMLITDNPRAKHWRYRAPEAWPQNLIDHPTYSFESDVYSFAMCFAYSLTGQEPFEGTISRTNMKQMIEEGKEPVLPSHCPLILKQLLMKCWSKNPSSRPSFTSISMALRHLKVLLMKVKASDRFLDASMEKEYSLSAPMISYSELLEATRGLSEKVDNVSMFGMYHGVLSDGSKMLVRSMGESLSTKLLIWMKVSQLLQLRQGNILSLRAISLHGSECWFVYEEKSSILGSLDSWLEEGAHAFLAKRVLDVTSCYKIALGVACGLQYLHAQDLVFVITPENILLDENHEPKIIVDTMPAEGSMTGTDLEDQQRLDVMHFGTLLAKMLGYLAHLSSRVDLDDGYRSTSRALDVLAELESLCTGAALRMDEVVEVLERCDDEYDEDGVSYEEESNGI